MKHTKAEILNALKIIKDECAENKHSCSGCPFFSSGRGCAIKYKNPEEWNIKEEKDEIWRAFE